MFCHICGAQIEEGSVFCHECGTKVVYDQSADTEANSKINVRILIGRLAKIVSVIVVVVIISAFIKSGALRNAMDTLEEINREIDNQATGATTMQGMQSFDDNDPDDGMTGYDQIAEDYYGQYQNFDSSLVGRWRSYDGGTLEFSDSGIIASCDFQCWSLKAQKPDIVYWEASNGRVSCSAYFYYDVKYKVWTQFKGEKDEREMINIGGGDSDYKRVSGIYGGGIVGKWVSIWGEVWSYQFDEDGTGMWNGRYPFSWYTYTTDDGNRLNYSLLDSTYFDYSVTGNMLTVFLSDSSRVYTKVGD